MRLPSCESSSRRTLAGFLILALLTILVFAKTAAFEFVWDDEYYIVSNLDLRSWRAVPRYFTDISTMTGESAEYDFPLFRPTRNLSYLVDFTLAGLEPAVWHLHNVLVHLINGLLVYLIARYLLRRPWPALFAGALFLVHPVQTEAVAWVKCRDDLLAGMFTLAAFLLWLAACRRRLRPLPLTLLGLLYVLACLSKIQAVVFPLLLFAFEALNGFRQGCDDRPGRITAVCGRTSAAVTATVTGWLGLLGFCCLLWRHFFIGHTAQSGWPGGGFWPTMLTMLRAGAQYARLMIWPHPLVADYAGMPVSTSPWDWRVMAAAAVLAALLAITAAWRRSRPPAAFGMLWIAICLLPMANLVPMMQFMAERFLYLPLVGLALLAAAWLAVLEARRPRTAQVTAALLIAAAALASSARLEVWRNNLTLYRATVAATPETTLRPRRNLLTALLNRGRYEEALPLARRLWETTVSGRVEVSRRRRAEHARHLGAVLLHTGQPAAGVDYLEQAIALDPEYVQPHLDLGVFAGLEGNDQAALWWFRKAVGVAPDNPDARFNLGIALRETGQPAEAEQAFRRAIEHGYGTPQAHLTLAALLWRQNRFDEAAEVYRQGRRIWPDNSELREWAGKLRAARRQHVLGR